ncbi:MAG: hypothetical protein K2Y08_01550 [Alphaproteobacteria bacterium]|nr:hypothetical protein [Alphaproteobacteria bacterium]
MMDRFYNYECFLTSPMDLLILIHGTILGGILLSKYLFLQTSSQVWNNLGDTESNYVPFFELSVLSLLFFSLVIVYLQQVPLQETGLYHMFIGSAQQANARELSLKLMDNHVVRYLYSILKAGIAPVFFLILLNIFDRMGKDKIRKKIYLLAIMGIVILLSNLNGEKSFVVNYAILMAFYYIYKKRLLVSKRAFFSFSVLLLVGAVIPSLLLSGGGYPLLSYVYPKIERAFLVPLKVGLWYMHDAQIYDFDLKMILPQSLSSYIYPDVINYPNFIGKKYGWFYLGHKTLDSINANASFIFYFYKGIGLLAVPFSIFAILSLDTLILFYRFIRSNFLPLLLSFVAVKCISFVSTNFYTVFLSHGLLLGVFLFLLLTFDMKKSYLLRKEIV